MKTWIEYIIRKRNPNFKLDENVNSLLLLEFSLTTFISLIRGLKWFFYFKNPKMSMLGKNTNLNYISRIRFGNYLKLGDNSTISALGTEGVTMGNNVGIGAYSRIIVSTSFDAMGKFIRIGDNVGIGEYAYLGGAGGLEIGSDCIIGQYFSCHPENHNFENLEQSIRLQGVSRKGIRIGQNCWIGSKVTILDGVEIGNGCVIAAGSVVNKSFPDNSVIGGVPAKLIKNRTNE